MGGEWCGHGVPEHSVAQMAVEGGFLGKRLVSVSTQALENLCVDNILVCQLRARQHDGLGLGLSCLLFRFLAWSDRSVLSSGLHFLQETSEEMTAATY